MATILPFVPPPGSGRIRHGAPDGQGSVVIFPGVRYEREGASGPDGGSNTPGPMPGAVKGNRRRK